jgi:hypothetical protein
VTVPSADRCLDVQEEPGMGAMEQNTLRRRYVQGAQGLGAAYFLLNSENWKRR